MNDTATLGLIEAAKYLNITRETLLEFVDAGAIPAAKIGREWVFMQGDLAQWLRERIAEQTTARRDKRGTPVTLADNQKGKVATAYSALVGGKRRQRDAKKPDLDRAEAAA